MSRTSSTIPSRSHRRGVLAPLALLVAGLAMILGSLSVAGADPVGSIATYSQTANAALPPATNFSGSAGGDGWGLVFTDTNVYNVLHHTLLAVSCHSKATSEPCPSSDGYAGGLKYVTQVGVAFYTGMGPAMYIDETTNHLFVWATKFVSGTTQTAGIVEVDLGSTDANPFVAFHALSAEGEAACQYGSCVGSGNNTLSNGVLVGSKFYSYNYVTGLGQASGAATQNTLLCFDLAAVAPCAGQPYPVVLGSSTQGRIWPAPPIAAVNGRVYIDIYGSTTVNSLDKIACVDVSAGGANCGGWPINPPANVASAAIAATPFPLLNSSGTPIGVCFPGQPNACTDFDGTVQSIPTDLEELAPPPNSDWAAARSEAVVYDKRIYVPNVDATSEVWCFDFVTGESCADFPAPKTFDATDLSGIYSIQQDPSYPSCLWVNADSGTAQIQNFDYWTGDACGSGGSLLPITRFVASNTLCEVKEWKLFELVSPSVGNWTSGTVEFDDAHGDSIDGLDPVDIGSDGSIDLLPLDLQTYPTFGNLRVKLVGASTPTINVRMTWTAGYHPECTAQGQVAVTTSTSSTSSSSTSTSSIDPTTTASIGEPEQLPYTGSNPAALIISGFGVLAIGTGMVLMVRRRERTV